MGMTLNLHGLQLGKFTFYIIFATAGHQRDAGGSVSGCLLQGKRGMEVRHANGCAVHGVYHSEGADPPVGGRRDDKIDK